MSTESPLVSALPRPAADGFAAARRHARKQFIARGLPDRREEAWKYTDLTPLGAETWPRAKPGAATSALPTALGRRLLWTDGVLGENAAGDFAASLSELAQTPPQALVKFLGSLACENDPVVALNTTLFDHGAWIDLPDGMQVTEPLELVFSAGEHAARAAVHARLALHLGAGSRLTLIERHIGGGKTPFLDTRVAEIRLDAGAELTHLRLNEAGDSVSLLGHTAVHIGEAARYRFLTLDLGAGLARETLEVVLAETDGEAELNGLALLDGKRHADTQVTVEHAAIGTRSRQHFRGILDGRSRGVYSGLVRVQPGAQKSDAAQESANLLLSRRAEADVRPQLEIYADDVACSHGSATGAIDEEALFYLQSRGVDKADARRIIAYGFAVRALDALEDAALRRTLAGLLADRLNAPAEIREWL